MYSVKKIKRSSNRKKEKKTQNIIIIQIQKFTSYVFKWDGYTHNIIADNI